MSRRLLAAPIAFLATLVTATTAMAAGPSAIGTGSDGTSYVGYPLTGGVQRIDAAGSTTALPSWGTPGTGAGQLGGAVGIAVAPGDDGRVYVLDTNLRVQEFTKGGQFVKGTQLPACASGVTPDATTYGGIDVRVDGASTTPVAIYVSHPCRNEVLKLDPASSTLATTQTATTTSRPGRIASPRYLTGPANTRAVFVALPDAKAVTSFAPTDLGAGAAGTRSYDFTPSDVFIDEFGVLAVGDRTYQGIRLYGSDGSQFRYLGGSGSAPGLVNDVQAFDIAGQDGTDRAGNLFVADSGNQRVQRWNSFGSTIWTAAATGTSGGPATTAPVNSAAPTISGSAVVGQQLTCSPGTWTGSPTYAYSWRRDGSQVATGAQYTLTSADAGRAITCQVTGTNGAGSATATSAAVTPTAAPTVQAPTNTAAPQIQGTAAVGSQVTCSPGSWTGSPTYGYSWRRDGGEVATGATYTLTSADAGRSITCVVTATNAGGSATATSAAVSPPAPVAAPVNTGRPGIQGTTVVGNALTCTQGTWSGSPTGYAYAWRRDGAAIAGATGSSYTLVAADAGRTITCAVTASNAGGSATAVSDGVVPTAAPTTPSTRIGVTINNGAEVTNTPAVSLRIREPAGATAVLISNDGSFDAPTQVAVAADDTYAWRLDARGSERRARVVYVRFVGTLIDQNQTFSDDILLDTTAPTVTTATVNARTTARTGTASVAATDTGSGVSTIQYARNQSTKGARTLRMAKKRSFKVTPKNARWVRAVDVAGNKSTWKRIAYKAPKARKR